ncbi:MAG: hypothetical protein FJY95_10665 [Candidatus Handelsmanbacteria bacterium]|nr:hypothetical protein [Candidatus Handelsmanbacteria bacterium]
MKTMNALRWLLAALLLAGCAEPDQQVTRFTADNRFALSLQTEKNWLHPGEMLPVRVRVESLAGPLEHGLVDTLKFLVNNGALAPVQLVVAFAGTADSAAFGVSSIYENWVIFQASPRATPQNQGEIIALFQHAQTTLKIRITPPAESL